MKILVVSDTHGRHDILRKVIMKERPFDLLLHAGDVEDGEEAIAELAGCECKIVMGNNDYFSRLPEELVFKIEGYKFFMSHGHRYGVSMGPDRFQEEAESRGADYAIYGHTHKPYLAKEGNLTVMNPGSLSYPRQEGRNPSYITLESRENSGFQIAIKYF
ncbi:MAG: metallophosphoesterase [Lachnospiraceae bacterium]|nr:metallophosphoesterase [Lachnospiraceae bacterium]